MGEVKDTKKKEVTKKIRIPHMEAVEADNLKNLLLFVNDEKIKKEDIVSMLKEDRKFVLVYYK